MHTVTGKHADLSIDALGVATLTIVNAKSMNVLGTPVIDDLTRAIEGLRDHPALRVLVFRGSGDKAFIGGADIYEMSTLTPPTAERFITRLRNLCDAVRNLPVPVIARLSGWSLGGGLEVALSCDLRIGSTEAHYGMPEVRVGIPSVIHAALMPRLIGQSAATWLLLTGETIDAATAQSWGLVHRTVPQAELDAAVQHCARHLATLGPQALRQQKALLRSWETLPLDDAIAASVTVFGRAFATGEPQTYMAAFKNRTR
ncbi:MAG: enoyl-CoA hydratase [Candidatus Tectomicrobia bacterium]|uniref:Enoyl-CoA hydratase n=1 Tax=Tectimicrobiota bacterium TaxID=2528274 RepID=A0A937VZH8_UNCTE|nr:enoyl-CoA hydratase [Candidatus Tectomicrobia bacterium]